MFDIILKRFPLASFQAAKQHNLALKVYFFQLLRKMSKTTLYTEFYIILSTGQTITIYNEMSIISAKAGVSFPFTGNFIAQASKRRM